MAVVPVNQRGDDYAAHVRARKNAANWTCQSCGQRPSPVALILHHKNSNPLDRSDDNEIVICDTCHSQEHHWGVKPTKKPPKKQWVSKSHLTPQLAEERV